MLFYTSRAHLGVTSTEGMRLSIGLGYIVCSAGAQQIAAKTRTRSMYFSIDPSSSAVTRHWQAGFSIGQDFYMSSTIQLVTILQCRLLDSDAMANDQTSQALTSLRLVSNRLSSTPSWRLTHVVPVLAESINGCSSIVLNANEKGAKGNVDLGVYVHKIRTRISALLQDKSPQARWTAIVLVKAFVEAGGIETLRISGAWVRSMIGILTKQDPASTKKLCIITLTRCFLVSQGHQSVVRELTTPMLPAFLNACINLLRDASTAEMSILLVTLQALNELLPYHPASFRPFQTQIYSCILPMVAPTPSSLQHVPEESREVKPSFIMPVVDSARRVFVLLSVCAPKRTEADAWTKSIRLVCDMIHATADKVFRALIEDRELTGSQRPLQSLTETVCSHLEDPMEFPSWTGIQAGVERLVGLLKLLQASVSTKFDFDIVIPMGLILDIFNRLLSVHPPPNGTRPNPEIGRDERDGLLHALPLIHTSAIDLMSSVIQRMAQSAASFYQDVLGQCLWVLEVGKPGTEVRAAAYDIIHRMVLLFGLTFPVSLRLATSSCLASCCEVLLPPCPKAETPDSSSAKDMRISTSNGANHANADAYQRPMIKGLEQKQTRTHIQIVAANLITAALMNLPIDFLPPTLRSQIDRTAILIGDENMLLASVLYPPNGNQHDSTSMSLSPFLARAFPHSTSAEAVARPRRPVIDSKHTRLELNSLNVGQPGIEESPYHHVYSGDRVSNVEIPERPSTIEDSTQADKDFNEEVPGPASYEIFNPIYSQPQTAATSMVEVPETQPAAVISSNKRGQMDITGGRVAMNQPNTESGLVDHSAITEPEAKRPRLAENPIDMPSPFRLEYQQLQKPSNQESQHAVLSVAPATSVSTEKAKMPEADSDSDSPLPTIDPTLSTDEEDEEDDEADDED